MIKITFKDKQEKVFAETKVPPNYKEAIVKTKDSSRGYAVRLDNPKGGYLWIGVAFRDRNDAFDFGVLFPDESDRNKMYSASHAAPPTPTYSRKNSGKKWISP